MIALKTAGLQPTVEMLELFASQMPNQPFSSIIVSMILILYLMY
jgi:ATP-dependent RNA helicase SUPV3L1/SUV3